MPKAVYGHLQIVDPVTAAQLAAARARIAELEAEVSALRLELELAGIAAAGTEPVGDMVCA